MSSNTVKTYNFAVSKFQEFCHSFGISSIPTLNSVINFIAWMSLKGYKPSTVVSYIAGISYHFKLNGLADFTEVFIVRKMLKGLQRSQPSKDIRAPVTIDMLKAFPRALRNVATSDYEALLFLTAFVVMFFGFLRVGEIAIKKKNEDSMLVIQKSDVSIINNEAFVNLRFSKTDQQGKGVTLIFSPSMSTEICPVSLLKQYLMKRPSLSGALFCHFNGDPITRFQVSSLLNRCLRFLGLQSAVIRPHSFRIGACSMAISQHIPEAVVREMGRWSQHSTAFQRYIRLDKIVA